QFWHKACFHCETCKMTLNMKNYKGYEKKPYCNAHYPKQSFTMVADTPENLRLKQQSELQSQVSIEASQSACPPGRSCGWEQLVAVLGKGKMVGCALISFPLLSLQIKYHEEFERSRMGPSPSEGTELERRNSQESTNYRRPAEQNQPPHHVQPSNPVYQQQQPPPPSQSYGYKEPAAPAPTPRCTPSLYAAQRSFWRGGEGLCPLTPLSSQKRFRAVYDYNAADEDEVSFQDGDTIINVQQIDDGWMYGTVERTGDTGMLPANYVEAI
ncbi:LIM and SH3 domain protein 1, partial [Struthio camelus australis]